MIASALKLNKAHLAALDRQAVEQHLQSRGWARTGSWGVADVYRFPVPTQEVLLPRDRELVDYPDRMADVALALAAIEKRPIWEVLTELSLPPADVLRLRLAGAEQTPITLPLEVGLALLGGGRDLLAAAATEARINARSFLAACRLGPGERGGQVATILIPVPEGTAGLLDTSRVAPLLWNTLQELHLFTSTGEAPPPNAPALSAALGEALGRLAPEDDSLHLEIALSWARSRSPAPPLPAQLAFTREQLASIAAFAHGAPAPTRNGFPAAT